MTSPSSIVFFSIAFALVLLFLISSSRRNRKRKAILDGIPTAPLPHLPLSFQWNWWFIALFLGIQLGAVALFSLIAKATGVTAIGVVALAAFLGVYYVYGYLRFALKGPSFVLDANGIAFAGNYVPWRDISGIDYYPYGKTPNIRFRLIGTEVKGFSVFDQFYGKTSVSANFIAAPDYLVGWSRRFKEESQKTSGD